MRLADNTGGGLGRKLMGMNLQLGILCLVPAFLLGACADSSGVFLVGNDVYQISTRATWELGGRAGARAMALKESTRHCTAQDKNLRVVDSRESYGHFEGGTVNLQFRCTTAAFEDGRSTKEPNARRRGLGPLKKASVGSGFFVTAEGHLLTNEHVVNGCRELRVGSEKARRIAEDEKIDIALLKAAGSRDAATFRGGRGIRAGDDVIVAGYPLQGLLASDMSVTAGIVSALAGPGGNRNVSQITAPVQPGNSGGPVLDRSGNVVGVVMAKLNAIRVAQITGTLPENVNFAISGGAARAFLDAHDVLYETAPSDKELKGSDIAERAKRYTVLIECWR